MRNDHSGDALTALVGDLKAVVSPLRKYLGELYARYKGLTEGKPADYIPELAQADPNGFGICVTTLDGRHVMPSQPNPFRHFYQTPPSARASRPGRL